MLNIRLAETDDVAELLRIFDRAKAYMKKTGNLTQWAGAYPDLAEIEEDLARQSLYVVFDDALENKIEAFKGVEALEAVEAEKARKAEKTEKTEKTEKAKKVKLSSNIVGCFAFIIGEDPTYRHIYDGKWRADETVYGTIHRLASDGRSRGVAETCFTFCKNRIWHLRVDTHEDNQKMKAAILAFGFQYCGKITCGDGTERLAYDYINIERVEN